MARKSLTAKVQTENMDEKDVAAANILVWMSGATVEKGEAVKLEKMKREVLGRSRETLRIKDDHHQESALHISIDGTPLPRFPPIPFLNGKIDLTACSVPFEKQLTPTDVRDEQNRLSLNRDEVIRSVLPLLDPHEDLQRGVPVTAYNPDGKEFDMTFKSWSEKKVYVLNGGWKRFFRENRLMEHRHWVTVWMFRHSQTRKLCCALTWKLTPIDRPKRLKSQKIIKMER